MGNRLDVGRTVAVFHEESLIVFKAIGGARHGVIEAVGVIILEHFPRPLLEIRRGDHFQVGLQRQSFSDHLTRGRLRHDPKKGEARIFIEAGSHDFGLPSDAEARDDRLDCRIVAPVESRCF